MAISTNQFYEDSSKYVTPHKKRSIQRPPSESQTHSFVQNYAESMGRTRHRQSDKEPIARKSLSKLSSPRLSQTENRKNNIRNYFFSTGPNKKHKKDEFDFYEENINLSKKPSASRGLTFIQDENDQSNFSTSPLMPTVQNSNIENERVLCETSKQQCKTTNNHLKGIPTSLKNFGNTCYLNSVIQSLFSLNFFITDLKHCYNEFREKIAKLNDNVNEKLPLMNELIELYDKVKDSPSDGLEKYLRDFKKFIGEKVAAQFGNNQQQDAEEFLTVILSKLCEEIEKNCSLYSFSITNPVCQFFQYKLAQVKCCLKCDRQVSIEYDETTVFHLALTPDRALQSAFMNFLNDETCTSTCSECSSNNIIRKHFEKVPKVLIFQSGRCLSSFEKDTNNIDAPHFVFLPRKYITSLDLNSLPTPYKSSLQKSTEIINSGKKPFVKKLLFDEDSNSQSIIKKTPFEDTEDDKENAENSIIDDANQSMIENKNISPECDNLPTVSPFPIDPLQCEKYQLISIICHIGSDMIIGHYISFVYNFEHSKWFKCNDEKIREVSYSDVLRESSKTSFCYFYVHTTD